MLSYLRTRSNSKLLLLGFLGLMLILCSLVFLLPLFALFVYQDETLVGINTLLIPGSILLGVGLLLMLLFFRRKEYYALKSQSGIVIYVVIWLLSAFIFLVPFLIYTKDFTIAIYEAMSALSTSSFSTVSLPQVLYLYKCLCTFFGGVGLMVILISFLSNRLGINLFKVEGHSNNLSLSIGRTSKMIFLTYIVFFLIGMVFYLICGVDPYTAITLSLTAISSGGGTNIVGKEYLQTSMGVQAVTMILMILPFFSVLFYLSLFKGDFKRMFKDSQLLFALIYSIILILILFIDFYLNFNRQLVDLSLGDEIWIVVFEFVATITTTGFSILPASITFLDLPSTFFAMMIFIALIGGQSGTVAGGIKLERLLIFIKGTFNDFISMFRPANYLYVPAYYKEGEKKRIDSRTYLNTTSYILIYVAVFFIGTLSMTIFSSLTFNEGAFNFASALSGTGNIVKSEIVSSSNHLMWSMTVGMFIGRLEIIPVFMSVIILYNNLTRRRIRGKYQESNEGL